MLFGVLAQLGERYTGSVEVSGSIPLYSTKSLFCFAQKRFFVFSVILSPSWSYALTNRRARRISYR